MWISAPMPVTTRIITDESGSSRNEKSTPNSPDVIHLNATWTIDRSSTGWPTSCQTDTAETANAPIIAAHATAPETPLLRRRPKLALMRKPTKGSSGMSDNISSRPRADPHSGDLSSRRHEEHEEHELDLYKKGL